MVGEVKNLRWCGICKQKQPAKSSGAAARPKSQGAFLPDFGWEVESQGV